MLTSGNPLNTNTSNASNVNNNTGNQSTKSNLLSTSSLINSEFMLPTLNNLTNNNPMASTTSYLNDYNKLYRDVSLFPPPQQANSVNALNQQPKQTATNLIGNNTLNSLVVNNLTSNLNNLGNHSNNLTTHNNLNGLQQNHNLNPTNLNSAAATKQQIVNNPDFIFYLNRCIQFLELNMYQNALDEINQALNLVPNSPVARLRKAQALLGLKRFPECEKELWNCINLDPSCVEYRKELLKVKQLALMSLNLNVDQNQILIAAQKYETIKDAADALMWSNNMLDFNNYATGGFSTSSATNSSATTNNLNETSLMNGWNMHASNSTTANNRFGSINQLINNGSNLLFNGNLMSNVNNNLLLNNNAAVAANLINRNNNNGTQQQQNNLTGNNVVNTNSAAVVNNLKNQQQQAPNSASNNQINQLNSAHSKTNNSSNSTSASNNQQSSNSPLNSDQQHQTNNQQNNLITNGLNNLSNGNNRFNYLLRGLDQHLLQQQQQSTNGQNSNNQNLINNQQQLYNRILPSFIENNNTSSSSTIDKTTQAAVLNCARNLNSKLNLTDNSASTNSILNGTNGLLMLNNSSAPSPICAKLTSNNTSNSNSGSNSASLTNSCNYNIFNQMPEMKLIETIVPNLLSSLNNNTSSSSNHQNNNANDLTSTNSTLSGSDLTTSANIVTNNHHKLLASLAKEVNNNVKDGLANNLVDNFTNNLQNPTSVTAKQLETTFDDCKILNNKKTGKSIDLINELTSTDKTTNKLDSGVGGILDLKNSNNSVKDDLLTNLVNNNQSKSIIDDNQHSLVTSCSSSPSAINQSNNQSIVSNLTQSGNVTPAGSMSATSTVSTNQCTSYSDIVKRAKKITQQSTTSNGGLSGSISKQGDTTNLTNKVDSESSIDDSSLASKRPTNLWAYNGLRVANVSLTASKQSLMNLFSKFGRVRLLERIVNKTTTNNIWVYFDNPVSPVDAVTKLQNVYIESICVDSESPLRLFFAPTDDQKDLKFSRPKQPPDNKGECYYWRTTNCFSKDQCPLLHIQANKNIDSQVWMRLNPEKEEQENTSTSNNSTANESASES